jgi:hypothetical protein
MAQLGFQVAMSFGVSFAKTFMAWIIDSRQLVVTWTLVHLGLKPFGINLSIF